MVRIDYSCTERESERVQLIPVSSFARAHTVFCNVRCCFFLSPFSFSALTATCCLFRCSLLLAVYCVALSSIAIQVKSCFSAQFMVPLWCRGYVYGYVCGKSIRCNVYITQCVVYTVKIKIYGCYLARTKKKRLHTKRTKKTAL